MPATGPAARRRESLHRLCYDADDMTRRPPLDKSEEHDRREAVPCQLTTTDTFGATVLLDHSNWEKHLRYRPELALIHPHLSSVLQDPDVVVEAPDGQRHFYRKGLVSGRFGEHYIRIIVGHRGGVWKIMTSWFQRTIDTKGVKIIWWRTTATS